MSRRIDRVDVRNKLPLRRDPYWHRLTQGRYVGFRRMTKGRPGIWLARAFERQKDHERGAAVTVHVGNIIEVKFWDKPRSIETFMKHLSMLVERKDVSVRHSLADLVMGSMQKPAALVAELSEACWSAALVSLGAALTLNAARRAASREILARKRGEQSDGTLFSRPVVMDALQDVRRMVGIAADTLDARDYADAATLLRERL